MEALGTAANLDIVSESHRLVRELARGHECAAKPAGAGGGDVAICFCPDGWAADALARALVTAGFTLLNIEFDVSGALCTPVATE
jgi:mevalonate kinase